MNYTLKGAYGRSYKTKKALMVDFEAGKDFMSYDMMSHGRMTSLREMTAGDSVQFRFDNDRKTTFIKVTAKMIDKSNTPPPPKRTGDDDKATVIKIYQNMEQLEEAMYEGVWYPECTCGESRVMESDARGFTCDNCNNKVELVTMI